MTEQRDIRGVLISVTQGRLLLPNASVAEVITYSEPEMVPLIPSGARSSVPLTRSAQQRRASRARAPAQPGRAANL